MKQALEYFTKGNRDLWNYKINKHNKSGIHNENIYNWIAHVKV